MKGNHAAVVRGSQVVLGVWRGRRRETHQPACLSVSGPVASLRKRAHHMSGKQQQIQQPEMSWVEIRPSVRGGMATMGAMELAVATGCVGAAAT